MKYPTMEEVEQASHVQLAKWYRFLPSPGSIAVGNSNFEEILSAECKIADRIAERFRSFGGMNASISKEIGWQPPSS
jgi:hypothetical protein